VQVQRQGRWGEAGVWFDRALALNPANLPARINAIYNRQCQGGDKRPLDGAAVERELRESFESYRNWADILDADGPVDEPTFLLRTAHAFLAGGDYRQAAREFTRCSELAPGWAEPKLWLALSYIGLQDFARALAATEQAQASAPPQDAGGLAELMTCQTTALQGLGRTNEAAACLETFLRQYHDRREVLSAAADVLEQNRQYRKELSVIDALLARDPNDVSLLAQKGWCELHSAKFDSAVATLSRVLSLEPSNAEARLHRAIALFSAGKLDAARADYQELLKREAYAQSARFGLAAIARRRQDTNAAIEFYQQFLSNSVPGTRIYRAAVQQLGRLEGR
jgi:tetratricopeptide (TPR) repeat protein